MRSVSAPPRAVVDTNLVVSALLFRRGLPHEMLRAWRRGAFLLVASPPIQAEYAGVFARPRLMEKYGVSPADVGAFWRAFDRLAVLVTPAPRIPLPIRDPKDEMVLATALGGQAGYVVTGDHDLLVLADDPRLGPLQIVTARAFLDLFERDPP